MESNKILSVFLGSKSGTAVLLMTFINTWQCFQASIFQKFMKFLSEAIMKTKIRKVWILDFLFWKVLFNYILSSCIRRSTARGWREVTLLLSSAPMRLPLSPGSNSGLHRTRHGHTGENPVKVSPLRWFRDRSISPVRKGWEPGEEKAQGKHINVYEYLKEWCKQDKARLFPVVSRARTRGNWPKLKHRSFLWISGNNFALWGWPSTCTSCSERFREERSDLPPQRWSWAAISKCPCLSSVGWTRPAEVHSNLNHPSILSDIRKLMCTST